MGRYQFDIACDEDDAALRQILAATPMPGRISVTTRREPSYFEAASVDGPFRQDIICRDRETKRIVAFGSRSVRERYVNGQPTPIGYLSTLRILEPYRNIGLVARAYRYVRKLHQDGRTKLYLTAIAEGNDRAIATLTTGRAGLPPYYPAGRYCTVAIPVIRRRRRVKPDSYIRIRPATDTDLPVVLAFLHRVGKSRQFFPHYVSSDLFSERGTFKDLLPPDLLLAFRNERLVGIFGAWDQRRFRQTVVEGYRGSLRWLRPAHNAWAALRRHPQLPRPGRSLRYVNAALPVVENNDVAIFQLLIRSLLEKLSARSCDYLLWGLHDSDPVLPFALQQSTVSYVTKLYCVCWEDGEELRAQLDGRPLYLELGCL